MLFRSVVARAAPDTEPRASDARRAQTFRWCLPDEIPAAELHAADRAFVARELRTLLARTDTRTGRRDDAAPIERWPKKRRDRVRVLERLAAEFEPGRSYTEPEADALIRAAVAMDDHALLRRELCVHGYLERVPSGARYWRAELAGER
mgnify:CR=1 FL=1